jgi:enoyl-CoA hydratase/carnithine racemase
MWGDERRITPSANPPYDYGGGGSDPSGHMGPFKDIGVDLDSTMVATIEIRRPPHNFFDIDLIRQIADACEALDRDPACRAIVLAAQGTAFCAGAKLGDGANVQDVLAKRSEGGQTGHLYIEAVRLFRTAKPMVGAIHGPAVGGGLGLALVPDLRVTCPEARFCANFTRLGFHPGFGLTHALPALIGPSKAAMMFYTSRRVPGEEALRIGLADVLVPREEVRSAAQKLAAEIAQNAPLGVLETRATLRAGLAERVRTATVIELEKQTRLRQTADFKEGVEAVNQRRTPKFTGR